MTATTMTRARKGPKRMTARYAGVCKRCDLAIVVGDAILWFGKGRAEHGDCDAAEARPDTRTHKQRFGRCEDAPCCGCCGPQGDGAYFGDTENRW